MNFTACATCRYTCKIEVSFEHRVSAKAIDGGTATAQLMYVDSIARWVIITAAHVLTEPDHELVRCAQAMLLTHDL